MKIIHALWEQRNMGVNAYEIEIEADDTISEFLERKSEYDGEYVVVKVPVAMNSFQYGLFENGFQLIEMTTSCYYDNKKSYQLNSIQQRLMNNISCLPMDSMDIEEMYQNISNGLFETDRISVDPFFTKAQANNRYIGWIKDELAKGSTVYKIVYQGKNIGFFGIKKRPDNQYYAFLGGVYKTYQRIGIGTIMNYLEIEIAKKDGAQKTYSAFSSNNLGAYAVHLSMGYVLDNAEYVFVKHDKVKKGD